MNKFISRLTIVVMMALALIQVGVSSIIALLSTKDEKEPVGEFIKSSQQDTLNKKIEEVMYVLAKKDFTEDKEEHLPEGGAPLNYPERIVSAIQTTAIVGIPYQKING